MSNDLYVIFGTGPVGMSIMDELCKKECRVRMVNRSGHLSEATPTGVEVVAADLSLAEIAIQAGEGASVIYNTLNPPYHKWVELFANLQASAIASAETNQAKLVVMDNLYMYGDTDGQPMTEDLPNNAHTKKGKLRAQMAREVMDAHQAGRVQAVVGRASDFFGARVMASAMGGDLVLKPAIQGKAAQVVGNVDMPHSYTYIPDVGRALVALAEADDTYGEVWHLPTPQAITTREMLQKIYAEAGHPLKMQVAPKWLLRIVGLFNKDAGEVVEMLYEFEKPFIIDSRKFQSRFGWGATDLDTAIADTVQWFKTQAKNGNFGQ